MPIDLYNAGDILEKTLYAAQDVPVYDGYPTSKGNPTLLGYAKKGNPVGIVYSYIDADPGNNRPNVWWMFYPGSNYSKYYFAPMAAGYYDVSSLQVQGVLSLTQKAQQEANANTPWYEKLASQAIPVIGLAIVGGAFIRGLLSRKDGAI